MCRIRDQIREAEARMQALGGLARALVQAGCPVSEANATAEQAFCLMRQPGRAGAKATINFHHFAPPESRSAILVDMYQNKVHPSGFGAVLARDWRTRSSLTVAAAGTRERLHEWFRYARFDLPFIRRFCDVEVLPARTTVWRGARADAALAAAGMSWSPGRELAAYYAHQTWLAWGHTAEPILLRREITREQVLAYFPQHGTGEAVIDSSGTYEIDTADPDEIAALAAAAEPMLAATEEQAQRCTAEILAASEDELFGEWKG